MLGHVVYAFVVRRCALAVLQNCFVFVVAHLDQDTTFDEAARGELRAIIALLPFLEYHAASPDYLEVHCSDASLKGYALHYGTFDADAVRKAVACRERWRFDPDLARPRATDADGVAVPPLSAQPASGADLRGQGGN